MMRWFYGGLDLVRIESVVRTKKRVEGGSRPFWVVRQLVGLTPQRPGEQGPKSALIERMPGPFDRVRIDAVPPQEYLKVRRE